MPSRDLLRRRIFKLAVFVATIFLLSKIFHTHSDDIYYRRQLRQLDNEGTWALARKFAHVPVEAPYKDKFHEVGLRARNISQWLSITDRLRPGRKHAELLEATERAASTLFPFLKNRPWRGLTFEYPLTDLRKLYAKGSQGVVIAVGGDGLPFRQAGQLLVDLRKVLDSQLPIQVAYAGDRHLTPAQREQLMSLDGFSNTEFLDVLSVFSDSNLDLSENDGAVKIFAVLASKFEQVILLDAGAVLMKPPEAFFRAKPYTETGAYLFHDRLLWQYGLQERHRWLVDQVRDPSPEMSKSRVWTEGYAEEIDLGVVVVDKSRTDVLAGLLHTAWQNTRAVRDEVASKPMYGGKESWWLGLELSGAGYRFEDHYGAIIGWGETVIVDKAGKGRKTDERGDGEVEEQARVCSSAVAHVDENDELLWYSEGLLKNPLTDPEGYQVPRHWMIDGIWQKEATKEGTSCMVNNTMRALTPAQKGILGQSMQVAKQVDMALAAGKETRYM
ncbi:putative alpha-1,3-mannosyltransferase-like protein [Hapsidospora chrysogenum ATCC 11550]|uniref:Putative alpha-1,3-mannosyltransferase-like protein n=1 Tax=Hapsidospora chrysogenum (strain ATCC 11550 / CBS 779.69 / DSM 880 / IAM 14645 / JCM 23072 / IMI 49137) TaxID=857340 RepID=A0A086SZW7_HAPC1|nr:putative alpha-1,3-mannosyltransferase-like protein [Hapsidospora chrysogenum ATCC 11550]